MRFPVKRIANEHRAHRKHALQRTGPVMFIHRCIFAASALATIGLLALVVIPLIFGLFYDPAAVVPHLPRHRLDSLGAYPVWALALAMMEFGLFSAVVVVMVFTPLGIFDDLINFLREWNLKSRFGNRLAQ